MPFLGFPSGKTPLTSLPAVFFSDLLPQVDDLGELKITLYVFWVLDQQEGSPRYILLSEMLEDERLKSTLSFCQKPLSEAIQDALSKAIMRGSLLKVLLEGGETVIFLNSEKGRAALAGLQKGTWSINPDRVQLSHLVEERPNIFRLYEENIGPLTPLIADDLRSAEVEYPIAWIEEAFHLAVTNNARSWRYILSILTRWKDKGKHETHRTDSQEDRRKYIQGDLGDLIEH